MLIDINNILVGQVNREELIQQALLENRRISDSEEVEDNTYKTYKEYRYNNMRIILEDLGDLTYITDSISSERIEVRDGDTLTDIVDNLVELEEKVKKSDKEKVQRTYTRYLSKIFNERGFLKGIVPKEKEKYLRKTMSDGKYNLRYDIRLYEGEYYGERTINISVKVEEEGFRRSVRVKLRNEEIENVYLREGIKTKLTEGGKVNVRPSQLNDPDSAEEIKVIVDKYIMRMLNIESEILESYLDEFMRVTGETRNKALPTYERYLLGNGYKLKGHRGLTVISSARLYRKDNGKYFYTLNLAYKEDTEEVFLIFTAKASLDTEDIRPIPLNNTTLGIDVILEQYAPEGKYIQLPK